MTPRGAGRPERARRGAGRPVRAPSGRVGGTRKGGDFPPRARAVGRAAREGLGGDQVEGRRAVRELLAAGRRPVRWVWIAEGLDPSPQLDEIEELASRRRVRVETVPRARLDSHARTEAPQGVLARATAVEPVELDQLSGSTRGAAPFLVVVAGVTDPRNLGALLRSAECAGVTGVVLPRHRSAHLSPTVAKVASGAIEHLDFALVGGIPQALVRLSAMGVFSFGLEAGEARSIYEADLGTGPVALVVGGEERGLPPLVRRRCDEIVGIPQHGALASLNAGVATAVACFEVARQRMARSGSGSPAREGA